MLYVFAIFIHQLPHNASCTYTSSLMSPLHVSPPLTHSTPYIKQAPSEGLRSQAHLSPFFKLPRLPSAAFLASLSPSIILSLQILLFLLFHCLFLCLSFLCFAFLLSSRVRFLSVFVLPLFPFFSPSLQLSACTPPDRWREGKAHLSSSPLQPSFEMLAKPVSHRYFSTSILERSEAKDDFRRQL